MSGSLSKDELLIAIYGIWHIWKERCRRVFQGQIVAESQLVEMIKEDLLLLGTFLEEQRQDTTDETGNVPDDWE